MKRISSSTAFKWHMGQMCSETGWGGLKLNASSSEIPTTTISFLHSSLACISKIRCWDFKVVLVIEADSSLGSLMELYLLVSSQTLSFRSSMSLRMASKSLIRCAMAFWSSHMLSLSLAAFSFKNFLRTHRGHK